MQKRKDTSIEIVPLRIRMSEKCRYKEVPERWIRWFYLFLAAVGGIYWIISMLNLEVSIQMIIWVTGLSSIWFTGVFGGKWNIRFMLPLSFGFVAVYILVMNVSLINGLAMILNKVSERVEKYYGTGFGYFEENPHIVDMESTLYLFTFLIVMILAYGMIRRQRMGTVSVFSIILLCACLAVDCFPDITAFMMWTCACLGLRAMDGKRAGKAVSYLQGRAGIWMLGCSVILMAVAYLGILPRIEGIFVDNHPGIMKFQSGLERKVEDVMLKSPFSSWNLFSGFTWQGKVESGVLTNSSPGRTGRTALTVTMDEIPKQNFYMKGFIGDIYDGNRWLEISNEDFDETVKNQWDVEASPDNLKKDLLNWPYEYINVISSSDKKVTYQVNLKEVNGRYGYLPYYTNTKDLAGKMLEVEGDGLTVRYEDEMSYEGYLLSPLMDFGYHSSLSSVYMINSSSDRNEILQLYENYVRQRYLYVPTEGIDRLKEVCRQLKIQLSQMESLDEMGYKSIAADLVKNILAAQCTYSTMLKPLPAGQDYTDYFFFDQKKGFCTHFASTGVLMFRQIGIPARYAAGYVVRPSDFKKENGNGGFTAEVPDGNAHAWVEIYVESLGWIPVEVTPGYYTNNSAGKEILESSLEAVVTPEPRETQIPTVTPDVTETPESDDRKDDENLKDSKEGDKTGNQVAVIGLLVVIGAAGFIGLVFIRRRWLVKGRINRFTGGDRQLSIILISHETYQMLKTAGYQQMGNVSDDEYAKRIQESFDYLEDGEFIRFVALAQKAKFSRDLFKEEDLIFCQAIYQTLERNLYSELGGLKKFWWKFIKCY